MKKLKVMVCAAMAALAGNVAAQMPTAADIEREMAKVDQQRGALFDGVRSPPRASFPNIPMPSQTERPLDLDAIAQHYQQQIESRRTDEMMIFASLGMPDAALTAVLDSARRVGAVVMLRGFKNNSVRETFAAIAKFGEKGANIVVNPNAFKQYRIEAVPVMVLAKPEAGSSIDDEGCSLPETYSAVAGDVTLDYALEHVIKNDPEFAEIAKKYLRLTKGPL